MDEKLKPCPFCGGDAYFDKDDESGWQWIECGRCHVATSQRASLMEDCKPLLAEAWNSRTTIDPDAIRAEARAEACGIIGELMSYDCFEAYPPYVRGRVEEFIEVVGRADAAILADEPKEERGAEVGDIVTWTNSHGARMIGIFGREITQGDAIILMRRAEVEAIISRGGA